MFEFEDTSKGHLVQPSCNEQGHLQVDQDAQNPVQPDLECLQGHGFHHTSGQPVPVPHHPYCKQLFPYIQYKSPLFQFETISPCPITDPAEDVLICAVIISENETWICNANQKKQLPLIHSSTHHPLHLHSGPLISWKYQILSLANKANLHFQKRQPSGNRNEKLLQNRI